MGKEATWNLDFFFPGVCPVKDKKNQLAAFSTTRSPRPQFFSHWKTYAYVIFVIAESNAECGEESGIIHWHSQPTGANCLLWFPVLSILSSCLGQPAHCSTLEQWIRSSNVHTWSPGLFCLGLLLIHWEKSNAWSAEQFCGGETRQTEGLCRAGCSPRPSRTHVSFLGQICQGHFLIYII